MPSSAIHHADARDRAIDNLRAMVTAQSALIFGLLTVLGEARVVPRAHLREVFETALEMVDSAGEGLDGRGPDGVAAARRWLQALLDDMPPQWTA